jgi:hypothetical protein
LTQDRPPIQFNRARQIWHLEKLYLDLANAKGRSLTPLEKQFLQGLLCGYSPAEIADFVYQNPNSSSVRVYLSNGLYRYIRELFIQQQGKTIRIKNWSCITNLLEKAGYRQTLNTDTTPELTQPDCSYLDGGEYLDLNGFLGRKAELEQLQDRIVRCRLVTLLGIAGQGKTLLAAKLVECNQERFESIIWRSLRSAPILEDLLADIINAIAPTAVLPPTELERLSLFMNLLRSRRCLIILEDFDGLFQDKEIAGTYRADCTLYSELIERLACERHRSCCLLISREQPQKVAFLEASIPNAVGGLHLPGLRCEDALQLPELQHLQGDERERQEFVSFYDKNPLVLKSTALIINTACQGNLAAFWRRRTYVLSNIRELFESQFQRLCDREQDYLYSLLLVERLQQLSTDRVEEQEHWRSPLDAIASLQQRLILAPDAAAYRLLPLWRTYLIERLIGQTHTLLNGDRNTILLAEILHLSLFNPQFA